MVVSSSRAVYISGNSSSVIILQKLDLRTELVVDCVRAGLKKKRGVEGGLRPPNPPRGGLGGRSAPPFANVLAFPPRKSFQKRLRSIHSSKNSNNTIEIMKIKVKVKSKRKSQSTSKSK